MGVNQNLFDLQVEHLLLSRKYSDGVKSEIQGLGREHRSRLTDVLKSDLEDYESVSRESTRWAQELYSLGRSRIDDFIGAEIDFQQNAIRKQLDGAAELETLNRGVIANELTSSPLKISNKETATFLQSCKGITARELTKTNYMIRKGLASGVGEAELIKQVLSTTKLTEDQAHTLVSTNIAHAQSLIKQRLSDSNQEIIKGVVFTAILDSRTSTICSTTNGLFQSIDNISVRPPLHYNCRSSLVPVLRSKQEMIDSGSAKINRTVLAKASDSDWTGELPAVENFGDWLRRQSMEVKMKQLGSEEKVALLEEGNLDWTDFFSKSNPISLSALRVKDNLLTYFVPTFQGTSRPIGEALSSVTRPFQVVRSKPLQADLRDLYVADGSDQKQALSLIDYRGTTLAGKRSVRHRANNEYDERNNSFDPFTGEQKSTLYYDPDYTLLQERLDYMKNSKLLDRNQKDFIESFVNDLDERISVNQQTAITENLRVAFERYQKNPTPWEDFSKVVRSEMNYSVMNVSQMLDKRSRTRDQLFLKFSGDPGEPSVQILGETVTLDSLQKEKLANENFVRDWRSKDGRDYARELFYRAKAPWRAYFFDTDNPPSTVLDRVKDSFIKRTIRKTFYSDDPFGFYQRYGKTPDSVKKILFDSVKKTFSFGSSKTLNKIQEEGFMDFIERSVREQYRSIVDLQFLRTKDRRSLADQLISKAAAPIEGDAINVLSGLVETIADGTMTDYDGLAINLGKQLRRSWTPKTWWMGSSLEDYHEEGSKILEFFRQQGILRVNSRGVVRRSVTDLETGRPSGNFKDTVSREVEILDPAMLKLQSANRKIEIANRLGVDRPENRYYVVPGKKTYVDARGNDTGVPLVTRSAFANFDEKTIDGDFADELNHTMSFKYVVDPEFSSFMDDVARFRDPRGNTEYYDNLNGFRKIITQRGDQGYGLMETIRYYQANGREFSAHARIDGRGRVYYNGRFAVKKQGELLETLNEATALKDNQQPRSGREALQGSTTRVYKLEQLMKLVDNKCYRSALPLRYKEE